MTTVDVVYAAVEAERARRATLYSHPETIQIGEGATMATALGGLYMPYTIIAVRRNGLELDIQRDTTINVTTGGFADDGEKRYEANPHGKILTVTKRKDGTYIRRGETMEHYSTRAHLGFRRSWVDYSN